MPPTERKNNRNIYSSLLPTVSEKFPRKFEVTDRFEKVTHAHSLLRHTENRHRHFPRIKILPSPENCLTCPNLLESVREMARLLCVSMATILSNTSSESSTDNILQAISVYAEDIN
ncbi:hypothetical protein CEXT_556951 [Caerostris extrusa]|uniref:Uncharacterized protein n=1 Tax=Caerostris extrusa TaxID=172846 RepID=A0AAV4NNC4_CAEEX|nr:hypothetical protein CEXT_556951 [Caerostris extrusa]